MEKPQCRPLEFGNKAMIPAARLPDIRRNFSSHFWVLLQMKCLTTVASSGHVSITVHCEIDSARPTSHRIRVRHKSQSQTGAQVTESDRYSSSPSVKQKWYVYN